jgi:predicted pyridoxine 5'-phosphate oxidase superfamily flavin-nucleotide-binding protein
VSEGIDDDRRAFIESRDFFFLSTVGADGWPTVSYKGGPIGVVQVEDEETIVFPSYDGNGMFLSMGNIETHSGPGAKIGLLFIDFETPNRLRLHATATVRRDDPALERFPGAELVVRARVENTFVNCARYIHPHSRAGSSDYVPDADGAQPFPAWKRIDLLQPFLPESQHGRAAEAGGEIDVEEYARRLAAGTS